MPLYSTVQTPLVLLSSYLKPPLVYPNGLMDSTNRKAREFSIGIWKKVLDMDVFYREGLAQFIFMSGRGSSVDDNGIL